MNNTEITMTVGQAKGMLRFHKQAYKAYKTTKQTENTQMARKAMIKMYLIVRSFR